MTDDPLQEREAQASVNLPFGFAHDSRDLIDAFTIAPVAMFLVCDNRICSVNRKMELLTGYSRRDLLDMAVLPHGRYPLVPPDAWAQLVTDIRAMLAGTRTEPFEFPFVHRSGDLRWAMGSAARFAWRGQEYVLCTATDVTDRKVTEQALRDGELRYRLVADNARDVIFTLDATLTPTFISPSVVRLRGYTVEEAMRQRWEDVLTPDSFKVAKDTIEQARGVMARGNIDPTVTRTAEFEVRCKGGSTIWTEAIFSFVFAPDGRPAGVLGIARDITDRKRTDIVLRYQASLVENVSNAVFATDSGLIITSWNPAAQRMYGWTPGEVVGRSIRDVFGTTYPAGQDREDALAELFQTGEWKGEVVHRRRDGAKLAVFSSRSVIRGPSGEVTGTVTVVRDVTMMKKAAERLRRERDRAAMYLNLAGAIIMAVDRDGKITLLNRRGCDVLGYTEGEALGMSWLDTFIPQERREQRRERFRCLMAGEIADDSAGFEGTVVTRKGELRQILWHGTVLRDSSGAIIGRLSSGEDITERKIAEQKLQELYGRERELREQLEREVQRRSDFARALVHELRTPLTAVVASSELLLTEGTEGPARSLAINIQRAATELNRRVGDLLDLARGEIGMLKLRIAPIDMMGMLSSIAAEMGPVALSNGQKLLLEAPASLPDVDGDESKVRQVVLNLLSNALKFTPRDGEIRIRAEAGAGNVVVKVMDTGPGISPDDSAHLFEAHYRRTDPSHLSGLGLGLAISKVLVQLHGGQIWVEGQPGKGSTFSFRLPCRWANQRGDNMSDGGDRPTSGPTLR